MMKINNDNLESKPDSRVCSNRQEIGRQIACMRNEAGVSTYKLAEMTGLKQPNIARIESGRYSTGFDILSKIGDALGYSLQFVKKQENG